MVEVLGLWRPWVPLSRLVGVFGRKAFAARNVSRSLVYDNNVKTSTDTI